MLKKTILACVLLHLVVGTISPQKIDSIDIKSMRAYLNCTPKVGQVKHYPVIERVRYCTGLFPFNRALILLLL